MGKLTISSDTDSSDDELTLLDCPVEQTPLSIDWVKVSNGHKVGITALPGCICSGRKRSLCLDVGQLRRIGVQDSFVLCTFAELKACKVRNLLWKLHEAGIGVHHTPIEPLTDLSIEGWLRILDELSQCVASGKRIAVHCLCGYGRSSVLVALLILHLNRHLTAETAIAVVRDYHGPSAICTVRQYNFVKEFRQRMEQFLSVKEAEAQQESGAALASAAAAASVTEAAGLSLPQDHASAASTASASASGAPLASLESFTAML